MPNIISAKKAKTLSLQTRDFHINAISLEEIMDLIEMETRKTICNTSSTGLYLNSRFIQMETQELLKDLGYEIRFDDENRFFYISWENA